MYPFPGPSRAFLPFPSLSRAFPGPFPGLCLMKLLFIKYCILIPGGWPSCRLCNEIHRLTTAPICPAPSSRRRVPVDPPYLTRWVHTAQRHSADSRFSVFGSVFSRFSATLGPKAPLERRGPSCSAGCPKNQGAPEGPRKGPGGPRRGPPGPGGAPERPRRGPGGSAGF